MLNNDLIKKRKRKEENTKRKKKKKDIELETDDGLCLICCEKERATVVEPCGHLVVCEDCSKKLKEDDTYKNTCIICKQKIEKITYVESGEVDDVKNLQNSSPRQQQNNPTNNEIVIHGGSISDLPLGNYSHVIISRGIIRAIRSNGGLSVNRGGISFNIGSIGSAGDGVNIGILSSDYE